MTFLPPMMHRTYASPLQLPVVGNTCMHPLPLKARREGLNHLYIMQALTKRPQIASAAVAIVWLSSELPQSPNDGAVSSVAQFHPSITLCEATHSNKTSNISIHAPSGFQKALASLHLKALPLPRRLLPNDPVFSDSTLKRGLRQRSRDESSLKILQEQVQKAVQERKDMAHIRSLHEQFCAIAYGSGVTPQEREDFVVVSAISVLLYKRT